MSDFSHVQPNEIVDRALSKLRRREIPPIVPRHELVTASIDAAVEGKTDVDSNPFLSEVRKEAKREERRKREEERARRAALTPEQRRAEDDARAVARHQAAMKARGLVLVQAQTVVENGELGAIAFKIERAYAYDRRVPAELRTRLAGMLYRSLAVFAEEGADAEGRTLVAKLYVEKEELELMA